MRRESTLLCSLVVMAGGVGPPPLAASDPLLPRRLASALNGLPHADTKASACVVDLHTGQTVFTHNADLPLIPASTQKVVAIAAALLELGPAFTFKTTLAVDGQHLYVTGDGDPGLGDPDLAQDRGESIETPFEQWAGLMRSAGHSSIAGDVVIDESIFETVWLHPTWEASDLGKWYAAPVGALNFNDNCVDVTVSPAARAGAPAKIEVVPDVGVVNVVNQCTTGGKAEATLHHPAGTFDYVLKGECRKRRPLPSVAFPDPGLLFAEAMRGTLRREGVVIGGHLRRIRAGEGARPANLTVVAVSQTPLTDAIARAGKNSQNLFAECLLKRAGYARMARLKEADPIGSWSSGATAALAMFERAGIDRRGLVVSDGSGLSRTNRATARQLAGLLAWCHTTPFGPFLHDGLARAGVDGSLRKRMKQTQGRVFAKTGTMRGVCALAGYVDGPRGPRFAFAVLFNDYQGPSTSYRAIQDRMCEALAAAVDD